MFNHLKYIPTMSYGSARPSIMVREAMRRRPMGEAEKRDIQTTCDKYIAEWTAKRDAWKAKTVAEIQEWVSNAKDYWQAPPGCTKPLPAEKAELVRDERIRLCESYIREWTYRRPQ